ncbi:MAG: Flagellar export chaperone FlgN [Oscillospiraceae bacterium]
MDTESSGRLISYFTKLLEFYRKFKKLEQEKREYLIQNKLDRLDECIKREQAFVLRARGLERERIDLLQKVQYPNAKFRELIPEFPSSSRDQAQHLYDSLSSVLTDMQKINQESQRLTEQKLRRASAVLDRLKGRPELQKIYSEKLKNKNQFPVLLSKKI